MTENNETMIDSRVYEICFIFDNKLDEETALKKAEQLMQSIATLGGSFISEETPYMRELAYEMIRVQNNINVRFNEGYFGWVKFEIASDKVKEIDKSMKLDEQVVRYLIVTTVRENTVYTKRAPVIKAEKLAEDILEEVNIDTTTEAEVTETKEEVKE
jgi:small subunit ribosomal protein S6